MDHGWVEHGRGILMGGLWMGPPWEPRGSQSELGLSGWPVSLFLSGEGASQTGKVRLSNWLIENALELLEQFCPRGPLAGAAAQARPAEDSVTRTVQ